jgi:hypothetical protein
MVMRAEYTGYWFGCIEFSVTLMLADTGSWSAQLFSQTSPDIAAGLANGSCAWRTISSGDVGLAPVSSVARVHPGKSTTVNKIHAE